jgi:hypothetical protein
VSANSGLRTSPRAASERSWRSVSIVELLV